MAISSSVVLQLQPRIIIPAYGSSSFSCRNKAHSYYSNIVASTRPCKVWSPIPSPRPKASPTVVEMVRTTSEKDYWEIQAEPNSLQHACEILKRFLQDTILALMTTNPIILHLSDAVVSNSRFIRWSSIGASYGALVVLKECAKVLWKSQPVWAFIVVGYLIYKANRCNIALYRNGRYPVWLEPLAVLFVVKFLMDFSLLLKIPKSAASLDILLATIDITASFTMSRYFCNDYIRDN